MKSQYDETIRIQDADINIKAMPAKQLFHAWLSLGQTISSSCRPLAKTFGIPAELAAAIETFLEDYDSPLYDCWEAAPQSVKVAGAGKHDEYVQMNDTLVNLWTAKFGEIFNGWIATGLRLAAEFDFHEDFGASDEPEDETGVSLAAAVSRLFEEHRDGLRRLQKERAAA